MPFVVRKSEAVAPTVISGDGDECGAIVPSPYFRWVRFASRVAAAVLLVPALPVIVVLVMLVHITSPGPGIYRQRRVGLGGRVFTLYKIRTMLKDAEARTGPVWTAPNDPRVTRLGRLLRPLHLDELPQLFNVLKGQMTLIGPRPERPEFTQHLARSIPGYMQRYCVMPGITGLAQINLPPDTSMESVRRKLVLDLDYIREAGAWLDAKIFLCTALKLFGLPAMRAARWIHLDRRPEVPTSFYVRAESDDAEMCPSTYSDRADDERPAAPLRVAIARHPGGVPAAR